MKVVVTGGSGKAGRYVTADLRDQGHQVLNVDWVPEDGTHGMSVVADLTDYGQARELIDGAEAVVHLAAIPAPGIRSEAETFRVNTLSTYNVFAAAVAAGAHRVVWASSETSSAFPSTRLQPLRRSTSRSKPDRKAPMRSPSWPGS